LFTDRAQAGRALAERLRAEKLPPDALVLGIPRGGVVVAAEVAASLDLPLDIVVAAKVGAPGNPEYAVGAVTPDGVVIPNPDAGYGPSELQQLAAHAREKVSRYTNTLRRDRQPLQLERRTVIVVDDGIATGLTALAAVEYLRRHGASRIIVAVPVASRSAAAALRDVTDEFVAVDVPEAFMAVGQFYQRFDQTDDAEVERLLEELPGESRHSDTV
jgi:putative phosphoribosyl transferase